MNDVNRDNVEILLISTLMVMAALTRKNSIERKKLKERVIGGGGSFRFNKNLWKKVDVDAMGISVLTPLGSFRI